MAKKIRIFLLLSVLPVAICYVLGLLLNGSSSWLFLAVFLFLGAYIWAAIDHFEVRL
jgi:hypothetical protein